MFQNASALRKLDLSSFDTRNVATNNRNNFLAGLNALVELRLGENTNIGNSALADETTTPGFLNSWKRETQRGPADWLSSQDLMALSGTAGEATGTWRRVPYQTNVQVKDSSIFIGEDWQPEDNFVSATDRYGETVPFDRITVEGTVDTDTAGTYKVTYTYDGVEATAEITVKARGGNGNGATNGGESNNGGTEFNNGDGTNGNGTSGEDDDRKEEPNHSDNKEDEHKQTSTDNLPRTGEIGGLFGALGLANLMLALTLWLKRRKLK
ncbi:bacterial Ig-like domain-containing protein [Lactococcus petauri]|uniref:bacterial Ig-like domain-containing protein n=1 Tax=Lactococcus petauri TaxID=1940789 RepID=UPI001BCAE27C|nr:bacterial Ig-like domain-containing protein [Lactococcus petauri]MBS4459954.1 bacterial Ig-like domain-containing protein [Lactococcus petauri]